MPESKERVLKDVLEQGDVYEPENEVDLEQDEVGKSRLSKLADNPEFMRRLPIIIISGIVIITIIIGAMILASSSTKKGNEDITETPDFLKEMGEEDYQFVYTEEEIEELRSYGYTGEEIEDFEIQQLFASDKIEEAKELIKERFKEEVAPMLDGASEAYKELERNTWIGGLEFEPPAHEDEWTYHVYELNADYERLPPRGNQLFIKIYLSNEQPAFINIGPDIYYNLKDTGNIVVNIEYTDVITQKLITDITVIK